MEAHTELEYVGSKRVLNKLFLVSRVGLYVLGGKSLIYKAVFVQLCPTALALTEFYKGLYNIYFVAQPPTIYNAKSCSSKQHGLIHL